MQPKKQINLQSRDGKMIPVEADILRQSKVLLARLQEILSSGADSDIIMVPEVDAVYLHMLIKWMNHRMEKIVARTESESSEIPNNQEGQSSVERCKPKEATDKWDVLFFQRHQVHAFRLMAMAKRLEMEDFIEIGSRVLFDLVKLKATDEIRDAVLMTNRSESTSNLQGGDSNPDFTAYD